MTGAASETSPKSADGRGETARMAGILAVVVAVVALLIVLGARRPLEDSAIGLAGLEQVDDSLPYDSYDLAVVLSEEME